MPTTGASPIGRTAGNIGCTLFSTRMSLAPSLFIKTGIVVADSLMEMRDGRDASVKVVGSIAFGSVLAVVEVKEVIQGDHPSVNRRCLAQAKSSGINIILGACMEYGQEVLQS
jgi:hypothetical protein